MRNLLFEAAQADTLSIVTVGQLMGDPRIPSNTPGQQAQRLIDAAAQGKLKLSAAGRDGCEKIYTVREVRPRRHGAVLFLNEITERSQAEALTGCDLLLRIEGGRLTLQPRRPGFRLQLLQLEFLLCLK